MIFLFFDNLRNLIWFQDLGYDRQLGYQTFMYGTEKDIRHLFSFLVSKLPKGVADSSETSGSPE